jgi:hypothetical protein
MLNEDPQVVGSASDEEVDLHLHLIKIYIYAPLLDVDTYICISA